MVCIACALPGGSKLSVKVKSETKLGMKIYRVSWSTPYKSKNPWGSNFGPDNLTITHEKFFQSEESASSFLGKLKASNEMLSADIAIFIKEIEVCE